MTARVVTEARAWIGTPYVHQASCRGAGADCLGLIRGVWRGIYGRDAESPPPYAMDWSEVSGHEHLWAAALRHLHPTDTPDPGDVILFRMRDGAVAKHLGIQTAIGPDPAFVHAYSGQGVVESRLTPPWARRVVARFRFPDMA